MKLVFNILKDTIINLIQANRLLRTNLYEHPDNIFKKTSFYQFCYLTMFSLTRIKSRIIYYVNNWIYTTNHKKIAVNYFWFVILAGIVGMVLATLIRLELAYPGVGIFAGDSLQYLSMTTAHGVIMVFFMIMPLLNGAFGNFLLPTQLGVHDVAFPRLNSAAFWFLPGGLLMLAQLVCIDRRYQRMNCFNIREIQSLLKKKFYSDLINTHDYHIFLDKNMINLKYKINDINYINVNSNLFFNYGIELDKKFKNNNFKNYFNLNEFNKKTIFYFIDLDLWNTSFFLFLSKALINFNFLALNNFNFNIKNLTDIFLFFFFDSISLYKIYEIIKFNFIDLIAYFKNNFVTFIEISMFYICDFLDVLFIWESEEDEPIFFEWWFYFIDRTYDLIFMTLVTLQVQYYYYFKIYIYYFYRNFFFLEKFSNYFFSCSYEWLYHFYTDFSFFFIDSLDYFYDYFETTKNSKNTTKIDFIEKNLVDDDYSAKPIFYNLYNLSFFEIINFYNIYYYYYSIGFNHNTYELDLSQNFWYIWLNKVIMNDYLSIEFPFTFNFYNFYLSFFNNIINVFYFIIINLRYIILNLVNTNKYFNLKTYNIFIFDFFNLFIELFVEFFNYIWNSIINLYLLIFNINFNWLFKFLNKTYNSHINFLKIQSDFFNISSSTNFSEKIFFESNNQVRNQKINNPIFKYDYKSGDYFPKYNQEIYNFLFSTIFNLTNGLKTSPWFYSLKFDDVFNFKKYKNFFKNLYQNNDNNFIFEIKNDLTTTVFYQFFNSLNYKNNFFLTEKWVSFNSVNQKFYKMFMTSSMQQRIYSNWKQLKFTREAWRCKMLSARHQKTLYKRYVNEDSVFWSIERNAKDLLPGWAMITPFSSRTRFTAIGKVDIGLMGVLLVLNSSIISSSNFIVTYRYISTLNNRKMRDARAFFSESLLAVSWMMIAANPMLIIGIIMLLSDRHWQTSFFDYSGGGDTVMFQHMFWFFGHPEVYIIIIPVFGFTNTIMSYYLRKRISARASLLYSLYTIAFLGFFVWGHHMYMVGLAHTTRMLFSTLTVMISVPAATKLMHWCVTISNSSFNVEIPFLFVLMFVFFFISGGISGMCVAHTGMDVLFHDTFYVIGHFHVMLAGAAMSGSFAAFYFYFVSIFGVKYSRIYSYLHISYYLLGQLMTVIPMMWLGYAGMPRRVLDYPASMGGWHSIISAGHLISVAGMISFFIMIFDSLRQGRAATRNTFGVSRFNTRLNFYLFEISKLVHAKHKNFYLFRFIQFYSLKLQQINYINLEKLETILITYTFKDKKKLF